MRLYKTQYEWSIDREQLFFGILLHIVQNIYLHILLPGLQLYRDLIVIFILL